MLAGIRDGDFDRIQVFDMLLSNATNNRVQEFMAPFIRRESLLKNFVKERAVNQRRCLVAGGLDAILENSPAHAGEAIRDYRG